MYQALAHRPNFRCCLASMVLCCCLMGCHSASGNNELGSWHTIGIDVVTAVSILVAIVLGLSGFRVALG
jgi:hypothetical protein